MRKTLNYKALALAAIAATLSLGTTACEDDDKNEKQDDYTARYKRISDIEDIWYNDLHFELYSVNSELSVGYNDIYFALKDEEGNYVEDYAVKSITPIMNMGKMRHSTAVGEIEKVTGTPLYHTWVSFVMATEGEMEWEISFDFEKDGTVWTSELLRPTVKAQNEGTSTVKSFKTNDVTYYITLANTDQLATGSNDIKAYINKRVTALDPYQVVEGFTVETDPRMPDMENHSSANNTDLKWDTEKKVYEGKLNLSMTGLWRINLIVKDKNGNIVAGSKVDEENDKSTLAWEINV